MARNGDTFSGINLSDFGMDFYHIFDWLGESMVGRIGVDGSNFGRTCVDFPRPSTASFAVGLAHHNVI